MSRDKRESGVMPEVPINNDATLMDYRSNLGGTPYWNSRDLSRDKLIN